MHQPTDALRLSYRKLDRDTAESSSFGTHAMFLTTLLTLIVFSGMVTPCIFLLVSFFLIKERGGVKGNLSKTIAQCPQKPHRMGPKLIQIAFRVENILGCNLFYTVHGCDCKIRRQLPNVRIIQNR